MKNLKNKSIYLIYDAVNCTPNGDPDNGEQRYNEITKKAVVSDLRIKRFGRERLLELGKEVFYFYDKNSIVAGEKSVSGAAARLTHFCEKNKIDMKNVPIETILLENFVDVRIFGGVSTTKGNSVHITGCVQWDAETNSINEVIHGKNLINRGITTVFPSGDDKGQGSMGRDCFLRYGLFCVTGRFNANVAKLNGATDEDFELLLLSIIDGMKNINTRSKFGHEPIACIVVEHPILTVNNTEVGKVFSRSFFPFTIKTDKSMSELYSRNDYEFDFTPLLEKANTSDVESVTIYCEDNSVIEKYFVNLPNKFSVKNPFDELLKLL